MPLVGAINRRHRAYIDFEFRDEGNMIGGMIGLRYFQDVDAWLLDRNPYERLPSPQAEQNGG